MKTEYQAYGLDVYGRVVHAGGVTFGKLSVFTVRKYQRAWERWRKQYLTEHPGEYPLRADASDPLRKVVCVQLHPIGKPDQAVRFPV